jgi:hypothetical protein
VYKHGYKHPRHHDRCTCTKLNRHSNASHASLHL